MLPYEIQAPAVKPGAGLTIRLRGNGEQPEAARQCRTPKVDLDALVEDASCRMT